MTNLQLSILFCYSNLIFGSYPISLTVKAGSVAYTSTDITVYDGYITAAIMFRRNDDGSWAIVTSCQDVGSKIIFSVYSKAASDITITGDIRVVYRKI